MIRGDGGGTPSHCPARQTDNREKLHTFLICYSEERKYADHIDRDRGSN